MLTAVALGIGLVIGFVFGWLVRDETSRPLTRDGFGIGVPGEWADREKASRVQGDREAA